MSVTKLKPPGRRVPSSLSRPAADLWRSLVDAYGLDDPAGELLLETALRLWDRAEQAAAAIAAEGLTVGGKPHPMLRIERDARNGFLVAMKQLNFDIVPTHPHVGRPPGNR